MILQSAIRAIYPAQCVACDSFTEAEHGLCGPCWSDTQFIGGLICDTCGVPLLGDDMGDVLQCDDCMTIARPWDRGRAALVYAGVGRRLVLGLKHNDRVDLALPAGVWMARAVSRILEPDMVIVPVPLHWTRLFRRRYNQAAELAKALGREAKQTVCVDALRRPRRTKPLEGHSRADRFAALSNAIDPADNRRPILNGRHVLLVDDVMTSGATLAAATEAALRGGAKNVSVVTLARVVKDT